MTKKDGGRKAPSETGIWYKSLIDGQSKAEYYRQFITKINKITTEYFGEDASKRLLKTLEGGKLSVPGVEMFLFDYEDVNDPSFVLYNTCKTLEDFLVRSIVSFKKRAERGETEIPIREFFLVMADIAQNKELYPPTVMREFFRAFILSLLTVTQQTPYRFLIVAPKWASEIGKQLGLDTSRYKSLVSIFLAILKETFDSIKKTRAFLPSVKVIYPVYYDVRDNQLMYLISRFRFTNNPAAVRNAVKDIPCLSKDTPVLRSALEYLRDRANLPLLKIDPIIMTLQDLEKSTYLKRYPSKISFMDAFSGDKVFKNKCNNVAAEPLFTDKESFEKSFVPYFCDVHIDCSKISTENLESFIDEAKILNLTKGYYAKTKRDIDTLTFKITLLNVKDVTKSFLDFIQDKLRRIESSTNKRFIMEIYYDGDIVSKKIPEDMIKYFRVISDIHADYNAEHDYMFNFGNDFILNCGDTSGNSLCSAQWINNFTRKGVFVIGNHLGYSSSHPDWDGVQNMEKYSHIKHPRNTKREQMKELFNHTDALQMKFLSNSCTEYQGIVIIGTCLYTDFNLYGSEHQAECMGYAKKYMNDFRLPVVMDNRYYTQDRHGRWWPNSNKMSKSCIRTFEPSDHAFYFQFSFEYIKKAVEEHKNKPIIIVTHHAPTPYAIDEKYEGDLLNAAFASNLNQYIVEHPEIRLWCFGHVHNVNDFILGETRMVSCPFGYNNENNFNLPYEYGLRIPISDIKNKKSWRKILAKSILHGQIPVYDE